MKFYDKPDIGYFVDIPSGWNRYCRYPANKSWAIRKLQNKHYINHYRDLKGASMPYIMDEDLYFKDWPKTRLIKGVCLPLLYAVGYRFIRLERGPPVGFTCALFPMNLIEARAMKQQIQAEEKAKKAADEAQKAKKSKKRKPKK